MSMMTRTLLGATVAVAVSTGASAATITWGSATTITDNPSDVSTTGTSVAAYSGNSGVSVDLNGVTFVGEIPGLGRLDASTIRFSQATTGDYRDLMANASAPQLLSDIGVRDTPRGTGNGTINLSGLSINQQYEVQVWIADAQTSSEDNGVTFTAGNSVFLRWEPVAAGPGQFAIGTFTADATTQDIALSAEGGWAYVNALQLRAVPEPGSLALLGLGGLMIARRRRD